MPLSFPQNPTEGDEYTFNNKTYIFNGTTWSAAGSGGGGGGTSYDEAADSTGYFGLPVGTTAQRPGSPAAGMLRFNNTIGYGELYNGNVWGLFGAVPPTISTVSPSAYLGNAGTSFDITGTNFTSDAVVEFIFSNGSAAAAASYTFVSNSLIQATTADLYAETQGPLDVRVTQASGIATKADCIAVGYSPTWTTAAGALGNVFYPNTTPRAVSFTVEATDPEGTTVTYSLLNEGSLPANVSLNANTGVISGDLVAGNSSVVTNNFSVVATEGTGKTAIRAFSILRKWNDGTSTEQYGLTAAQIKTLTGTNENGYYYVNLGNSIGVQSIYCIMDDTYDGGGWMMWHGNKAGTIGATQRVSVDTQNVSSSTPMLDWYNLQWSWRSGITAICTQGQTLIGTHNNTAVQGWAKFTLNGGTGYIWNSPTHNSGNYNFENLFTMVSSNGTTDNSVDVGLVNTSNGGGGDFGVAVDTLDHHNTSSYYNLNTSCGSQYIYQYGYGYKATSSFSGFNTVTSGCLSDNNSTFGFFIAQR